MRAVIQRVSQASVAVDGQTVAEIAGGYVILLGITHQDTVQDAAEMVNKIAGLRIFEDAAGKMNLSILDVKGAVLLVSQFTLYADWRKGRRPSFTDAARPEIAEPLVTEFARLLRAAGISTQTGIFGAHMAVALVNDGPVTIIMEYPLENDRGA